MIDFWIGLPIVVRLIVLSVAGILCGGLANHMIYSWAYFPRPISPWAKPTDDAPPRKSSDCIPILGWLGLRREASIHGSCFWLRPILIEIGLAVSLPALYWYQTQVGGLLPVVFRVPATLTAFEPWGTQIFLGHAILLVLMTAATFIDFDEQTIPDLITIPGTILALLLASCSIFWFMPAALPAGLLPATFSLPWWPPAAKWSTSTGLWTGLAIWSGWCFALADRRLILRKGMSKAVQFFFAGLVRYPSWKLLLAIWIAGMFGICFVFNLGGPRWHGLFSSLVGLAVGGSIVWVIRLAASWAMRMEAMGFGDVTLMAMIGAFVGWQAATLAFFLSPVAAFVIVIIQYLITRESRVPFGPYLCAGTMLTILFWDRVYSGWLAENLPVFAKFGGIWMLVVLVVLMIAMLWTWRVIKEAIFR